LRARRCTGQKCTATSRAVFDRRVRGAFLGRSVAIALVLGPVTDPAALVGPVISRESREAIGGSARLREKIHGETAAGDADRGYFCAPALVEGADPDSTIAGKALRTVLATFQASDLDHDRARQPPSTDCRRRSSPRHRQRFPS
jgi:acyl-CoA reductase-like NAD-dependent aldehyde dehydrogenase